MKNEIDLFNELKELICNDKIDDELKTISLEGIFRENPPLFFEALKVVKEDFSNLLHFAAEKKLPLTIRGLLSYAKLVFDHVETKSLSGEILDYSKNEEYYYGAISLFRHKEINGTKKTLLNVNSFFLSFINNLDNHLNSPLHLAVKANCFESVGELLANGANPDLLDSIGYTPLHWAIVKDHQEIALELLRRGARTDLVSYSLDSESAKLSKKFLTMSADSVELASFDLALLMGNISIIPRLIDNIEPDKISRCFYSSLRLKQEDLCLELLKKDLEIDFIDRLGNNLLGFACAKSDNPLIIEKLINKGFEINSKNKYGFSPLHNAVLRKKNSNIVELLKVRNDVSRGYFQEKTPSHFTIFKGEDEILKLLLAAGADVNAQDEKGNTPLHLAIAKNFALSVRVLLEKNANIDILNKKGQTPIDLINHKTDLIILKNMADFQRGIWSSKRTEPTTNTSLRSSSENFSYLPNKKRKLDLEL